jgi:hypothetical protein
MTRSPSTPADPSPPCAALSGPQGSALTSCHCPRCGKLKRKRDGSPHKCAVKTWKHDLKITLDDMLRVAANARRDGDVGGADYIEYVQRSLLYLVLPNP